MLSKTGLDENGEATGERRELTPKFRLNQEVIFVENNMKLRISAALLVNFEREVGYVFHGCFGERALPEDSLRALTEEDKKSPTVARGYEGRITTDFADALVASTANLSERVEKLEERLELSVWPDGSGPDLPNLLRDR